MVKPCLGSKNTKCVMDDRDHIFTSDMETLLSSLTQEHPVVELICQALKSHKEQYGEGVRTVMFMVTRIAKAVMQLEDLGIKRGASLVTIADVMDHLANHIHQISIPVRSSACHKMKHDAVPTHTGMENTPLKWSAPPDTPPSLNHSSNKILSSTPGRKKVENHKTEDASIRNVSDNFPQGDKCHNVTQHRISFGNNLDVAVGTPNQSSNEFMSDNIVDCDPVILKMSSASQEKEDDDDITWYFDQTFRGDEFEKYEDEIGILTAQGELHAESHARNTYGATVTSNRNTPKVHCKEASATRENCMKGSGSVDKNRLSNLSDGNQHDSDFEDCFDDLENRKQVVVVVERIDDCNGSNQFLNLSHNETTDVGIKMARNIQKHFVSSDFESVLNIPSLQDSTSDKEFNDCFDSNNEFNDCIDSNNEFNDCIDSKVPNKSVEKISHHVVVENESSVTQPGGIHVDSKPINSKQQVKLKLESPCLNSDLENNSNPKEWSELEKLNSLLTSINTRKSYSVKEILISSRHSLEESCFEGKDQGNNFKEADHFKKNMSSVHAENESQISQVQTDGTETKLVDKSNFGSLSCQKAGGPNSADLTGVCSHLETTSSALQGRKLSELEKLNTMLSSVNLKEDLTDKRQISLSSRYDLDEENSREMFSDLSKPSHQGIKTTLDEAETKFKIFSFSKDFSPDKSSSMQTACDRLDLKDNGHEAIRSIGIKQSCHTESANVLSLQANTFIPSSTTHSFVHEHATVSCLKDRTHHDGPMTYAKGHVSYDVKNIPKVPFHQWQKAAVKESGIEERRQVKGEEQQCVEMKNIFQDVQKHFCSIPDDLICLARGQDDLMELIEILYCSSVSSDDADIGRNRLNPHLTHCLSVQSPRPSRSVVDGLVIPAKGHNMHYLRNQFGCHVRGLLINGDLTPSHHHKGYKPTFAKKNIVKRAQDVGSERKEFLWASRILENAKKLNVSVMLVRGNTTDTMSDLCLSAGIVLITNIAHHALNVISHQLEAAMLCYAEDASESNVFGLCLEPLHSSWMDSLEEDHCLVLSNVSGVKSVVLSEPSSMGAQVSEEKFWKCFHRASNAVCDKAVLPGGGATESWCQKQVQRLAASLKDIQDSDHQLVRVTVLEYLADVFHDYANTVQQNTRKEQGEPNPPLFQEQKGVKSSLEPDVMGGAATPHQDGVLHNQDSVLQKHWEAAGETEGYQQGSRCEEMLSRASHGGDVSSPEWGVGVSLMRPDEHRKDIHWDTLHAKLSSWRSAVDLVSVLLSLDALIITGASDKDLDAGSVLL